MRTIAIIGGGPAGYVAAITAARLDHRVILIEEGIRVNERMQTTVPHIYACGDVIGGYQLAHAAFHEGEVAAANACGRLRDVREKAVPRCIYTRRRSPASV